MRCKEGFFLGLKSDGNIIQDESYKKRMVKILSSKSLTYRMKFLTSKFICVEDELLKDFGKGTLAGHCIWKRPELKFNGSFSYDHCFNDLALAWPTSPNLSFMDSCLILLLFLKVESEGLAINDV